MKPKIWRSFGWCDYHHKHLYASRKIAKAVCRQHHGEHKSSFECSVNPGLWHIGELAETVISGRFNRSDVYREAA